MELNGKKVYDLELEGVKGNADFCDAFIRTACWADGVELTDDELDALNNQTAELHSYIMEQWPL